MATCSQPLACYCYCTLSDSLKLFQRGVLLADSQKKKLTIQVLDDATETVAVGSDDDVFSSFDFRGDDVVPEGQRAGDGVLQGLAGWELTWLQVLVAPGLEGVSTAGVSLLPDAAGAPAEARRCSHLTDDLVVGVVLVHRGRRDVKRAAPDLHLLLAMLLRRLSFVETGQAAIVTFV